MWTPEQYVEMDRAACAAMRAAIGVKTFDPDAETRRREAFRDKCAAELERRRDMDAALEAALREKARRDKLLRSEEIHSGQSILNEVCRKYGYSKAEMMGFTRPPRLVHARREAWFRMVNELGWSTPRIGRFMNRDHSTVWVGIKRYREMAS